MGRDAGGAMVLDNFQCWGVLLICSKVGQGPTVLALGAGGAVRIFFLLSIISLPPSVREMVGYRLKYCVKKPKTTNQPT